MKTMNDQEKAKTILRLIQTEINHSIEHLIQMEATLASCRVKKEWADELSKDDFGGGFDPRGDTASENVRRMELSVTVARESMEQWKSIYDFTLNTLFKEYMS